jgi:ketosteroid isomerase-like protein
LKKYKNDFILLINLRYKMKIFLSLIFTIRLFITLPAQQDNPRVSLDSLVKSEEAFAKMSEEKGTNKAFAAYLTDDAIVFRPNPIKGKDLYLEAKEDGSKLIWKPEYADISLDGKLGFTTGPWKYSRDSIKIYGHYITIWQRQANSEWKVILDGGIPHPPINFSDYNLDLPEKPESEFTESSSIDEMELNEMEDFISRECKDSHSSAPLIHYFDNSIRFYITNNYPVFGKEAAEKYLNNGDTYLTWTTEGSLISDAGNLGFTYGTGKENTPTSSKPFSYLHIWKNQDGNWTIILNLQIFY